MARSAPATARNPAMSPELPAISTEVREAVGDGRPVVALETSIITHGLPRPRNAEIAEEAEESLRRAGVVPATTGVLDGVPKVGLTPGELHRLAGTDAAKASVRDLPVLWAKSRSAGTTVAATAWLAHRAGLEFFATGGLGGVHHGAAGGIEEPPSYDESADLPLLATLPITVVTAGVKSILDRAATLERMETLGITVVGFGTDRFPGFYVADSGLALDHRLDTPAEVAALLTARRKLGLRAATVLANPVPLPAQLDPELHERVVAEAWQAARERGISGPATTPFLLEHIRAATGDRSLEANLAAYFHNIAVAAECAHAAG